MIFGPPGSGKSTLATKLSQLKGIPVYHLDKIYMSAGWKKRNFDHFLADLKEILTKDEWIVDGNGRDTLEMRYQLADIAIYCHPPLTKCIY